MRLDTDTMREVAVSFSDIGELSVYETASFYVESGLSVIPIRRDGSNEFGTMDRPLSAR